MQFKEIKCTKSVMFILVDDMITQGKIQKILFYFLFFFRGGGGGGGGVNSKTSQTSC